MFGAHLERRIRVSNAPSQSSTLILGLGNPLRGDDGIGPRFIEELNHHGLPKGVAAIDGGTGGLDLLPILERWEHVVIVDAADMGQGPGQFTRFTPDQVHLARSDNHFSLHHAGLSEVLTLAHALERTLPEMVIFGVQPADVGWRKGLSPKVEAILPELIDAVLNELSK